MQVGIHICLGYGGSVWLGPHKTDLCVHTQDQYLIKVF